MAHLFAPRPQTTDLPVFFNVDGVVGENPAQNLREDVLLVQFIFKVMANSPSPYNTSIRAELRAVEVTGFIDTNTINAIRASQTKGNVKDGRVSPAKGYLYGTGTWTIVKMNNYLQEDYLDIWPRIDRIPNCPGEIIQMVKREVIGR